VQQCKAVGAIGVAALASLTCLSNAHSTRDFFLLHPPSIEYNPVRLGVTSGHKFPRIFIMSSKDTAVDSPWDSKTREKFESKQPGEYLDPCQEAASRSLKCLHRNGGDREMCTDYFQAYRDCKKEGEESLVFLTDGKDGNSTSATASRWTPSFPNVRS
jgi:cytochrome c oxidase assembly protein subunit 23